MLVSSEPPAVIKVFAAKQIHRKPDKAPAHQKGQVYMWKFEGIENDDATDAADGWNLRMRIGRDVDEIADERTGKDERKIAERMQKIFDVIAENQKEMHVAEELYRSVIRASLFLRHSTFVIRYFLI